MGIHGNVSFIITNIHPHHFRYYLIFGKFGNTYGNYNDIWRFEHSHNHDQISHKLCQFFSVNHIIDILLKVREKYISNIIVNKI